MAVEDKLGVSTEVLKIDEKTYLGLALSEKVRREAATVVLRISLEAT
jgi:hypothetical protein